MELQFFDLLENVEEVLEKDVRLLTIQDVVVAHDGTRLQAELRLGKH